MQSLMQAGWRGQLLSPLRVWTLGTTERWEHGLAWGLWGPVTGSRDVIWPGRWDVLGWGAEWREERQGTDTS